MPHYLETLRVYYGVSKAFIDLSFDFSAVNFTRLDATDAQMCMTLAEGAQSFQHPLVTHALSAAAGAVTSPFLAGPQAIAGFIYGPEFVNHSCMAYVLITRSFTDAIQYTGSYDDFKTGKFFDCFLSEVRLASEAAEAGVLELFDIIPMWRSCRVLPTRYDPVTGMPELMGYPRIQCDDSAFHEELSQTLAAPVRIMSAYFDYAATLSENLDSFDAARRVSTGCIFDEYSRAINASAHLLAVAIDQIPQSVPDGQFMVEFDGNLTEEIVRWIFPRVEGLFGGDDENITEDLANFIDDVEQAIVDALDEIPYANSIVNDPYLGPRPFGLGDVFPPVAFSIRSLPPLLGSLGVMFVETLRFVAETVHAGDFEHWDFDPDNLERLLRAQIDFTNALSSSAVSQLCLIKNLTSGVDSHGNPVFRDDTNCTARVHWDALNFTLCPLDFIPCAEPTLSKILSATVRVADMIPQLVLYSDDFIDKVFDPALCDLETAAYELDEILGAWNISADLPYWKTSLRLDISLVTSSGKYAGLKLLGVVNKILIEVLNGFVRNDFSASSGCTRDNPSWNGATCVKCYDIAEPTARCAAGFECCGGSGRCLERCFDGNGIMESVTDAAEALVGFTDALSLPLKVIDPMAHDVGEASGRSLAYMMQSLFEFIFARSELPPRAYGDVLPEFTCVSDELSVALGKLQGVGISVAGRFVSAVAELAGNENFAEAALENPQELANATSYLVNASGRVASETVGALLHLVGTVLDGAEYSSFEDWFLAATSYKCRVTNAFAEIPAAAGDVVRALDVTGHNAFCEPASLIQKLLRLVQDAILQSISLLNSLPRSPYLGKGLNIAQIFKTMRQILVEIGNVISYLLYAVFSVVIDNDTQLDKLANFFEGVGFFVAAILNLALSFLETIANFLVSVLDKFGIDSIICGASSTGDTYDIIAPMLKVRFSFLCKTFTKFS